MLNEAADLKIKAVDKNGDVFKSFVGDALLDVKGIDEGGYTLPNGGVVNFTPNAQGEVRFSKGIIFKQTGKATITAEDILDDKLIGKIEVEIKDPNNAGALKKILIISPTPGWVETNKNVNIIWSAKDLPNSPLQVSIDGKAHTTSSTNAQGEFSLFANDLTKGDHTLSVQISNAWGAVLAKSDEITFTVSDLANELYKWIQADPGTSLKEGDKVTLTLTAAPQVSTVELVILGQSYFMERVKSWIFEKILKFNTANNSIQIDAKLTADGNTKTYTNIEKLEVLPANQTTGSNTTWWTTTSEVVDNTTPTTTTQSNVKITSIKSIYDVVSKKYKISRTVEWTPSRYIVLISTNQDTIQENPELIQTTTEKQILVTPPSNATYYLQVIWADEQSNPMGEASEIVKLTAPDEYAPSAPTCVVDAIKLTDMLIAGKHYLVWNKVAGVDRYIVYRWDTLDKMNQNISPEKLGETVENRFEFGFDDRDQEPSYKYFAVQGMCSDWNSTSISSSTKIQVWPRNIALYMALIIWFMYGGFLITRKQE